MTNPLHFYYYAADHRYTYVGSSGSALNVFVAACHTALFEKSESVSHLRPEGFAFGTTDHGKVTCGNCRRTKMFKASVVELPKRKWDIDPLSGYRGSHTWLTDRTIFLTVHGSQAYGTNIPGSDIDVKGLCVPPTRNYFGFRKNFEQAESSDPYDMVVYSLKKFFSLAANTNPNILEILNTDPEDWIMSHPIFEKLYRKRHLFLSKKARYTFSGYAFSQLRRIKSHKKWLLSPPDHQPSRTEFGLPEYQKMSQSELGATTNLLEDGHVLDVNVMELYKRERKYQNALQTWKQFESWKKNRNKKRAGLEAEFGYDLKHAMHLVRLMTMCKEILTEGKVIVRRSDADMLLAIRSGEWSYDELLAWADDMESKMNGLYETSALPREPRYEELDKLCQELTEEALYTL